MVVEGGVQVLHVPTNLTSSTLNCTPPVLVNLILKFAAEGIVVVIETKYQIAVPAPVGKAVKARLVYIVPSVLASTTSSEPFDAVVGLNNPNVKVIDEHVLVFIPEI
jgi:hypothetical protein